MQQLIDAVRGAGARQPVIAEGLGWGGDLSGWLANRPTDPDGQLAAGWHIYNFSGCNTTACWDSTVAPVAAQVPVLATEVGENDCAGGFLNTVLPWADAHDIGYLAWTWNAWSCTGGPSLISDYTGTLTAFGAAYQAHIRSLAPSPPPISPPSPPSPPPPPLPPVAHGSGATGTGTGAKAAQPRHPPSRRTAKRKPRRHSRPHRRPRPRTRTRKRPASKTAHR
jgi:hypothetical protein